MTDASTIYALSSAPGRSAVAVIRVSGPNARLAIERMAVPAVCDRQAVYRRIVHPVTGALLDTAVVLFFAGPRSETGEDVAEFQIHGGRAVIAGVLAALADVPGLRLAEAGEFTRRALANGKLNLAAVESLADLVEAETEAQRKQAIFAGTQISALYEGWRGRLIEMSALTEAAIDFSDEGDVGNRAFEMARSRAEPLREDICRHLDDGHRGEILREGYRVVLLGPPNAGKSSLLNALARRDAAIVSEEAGTTRDVVEVRLDLGGYPVLVSDTAGLRDAVGAVEREGIRRSLLVAKEAQLILWLSETGQDGPPDHVSRESVVMVRTKSDLGGDLGLAEIAVSAQSGAGLADLEGLIGMKAASALDMGLTGLAVSRHRHRVLLETALASLDDFLDGPAEDLELRAEDLRRAAHALGRITGRVDVEDILDQVFSRFCIGK